ncbi:aspartate/tyrosine/aromatic aminotransferase [Gammaproteobacteria bacterium]|nr:aspartate/tyrosine/aromatic aminotransferase [Gammaproteobacteria bacterium]
MFNTLQAPAPDTILAIMQLVRADDRADKLDLSVGVFKDQAGNTPVMRAVQQAEQRQHAAQTSKTYVSPIGNLSFNAAVARMVLGDAVPADRIATVQTPGGSGALRMIAELIRIDNPQAGVWLSEPTWPNHRNLLDTLGPISTYDYFDPATQQLQFEAMLDALRNAKRDDLVVLHGCCHNPSGMDLNLTQWQQVADSLNESGAVALVDLAYHGFGDGLEHDVAGVRLLCQQVPTVLISVSASKNFGLYRDRVGCVVVVGENADTTAVIQKQLGSAARRLWSMPPHHGAALVARILDDAALRQDWLSELEEMRDRIVRIRSALAAAIRERNGPERWHNIDQQRGMFSLLGLDDTQIVRLRDEFAIYVVKGGRVNFAGLAEDQIERFADALIAVA